MAQFTQKQIDAVLFRLSYWTEPEKDTINHAIRMKYERRFNPSKKTSFFFPSKVFTQEQKQKDVCRLEAETETAIGVFTSDIVKKWKDRVNAENMLDTLSSVKDDAERLFAVPALPAYNANFVSRWTVGSYETVDKWKSTENISLPIDWNRRFHTSVKAVPLVKPKARRYKKRTKKMTEEQKKETVILPSSVHDLILSEYEKMTYVLLKQRAAYRDGASWTLHNIMLNMVIQAKKQKQLDNLWNIPALQRVLVHDREKVIASDGTFSYLPIDPWTEVVCTKEAQKAFTEEKTVGKVNDGISEDLPQIVFLALLENLSENVTTINDVWQDGFIHAAKAIDAYIYQHGKMEAETGCFYALTHDADGNDKEITEADINDVTGNTAFSEVLEMCDSIIDNAKMKYDKAVMKQVFRMTAYDYPRKEIAEKTHISADRVTVIQSVIERLFTLPESINAIGEYLIDKVI